MFQRDLAGRRSIRRRRATAIKPGLLVVPRLGPRAAAERRSPRATSTDLRDDIEALRKAQPPKYAFVHGVEDVEKPVDLKVSHARQSVQPGRRGAAPFPVGAESGPSRTPFTKGSGRLELADAIVKQPIAMRVIVNRIWKGHFGTGLVDTPSNFGVNGERPTQSRAARIPGAVVRRQRPVDQDSCTARSC